MDFTLSDEQQMLADTVARWLEADYGFEARRALVASPVGFAEKNWRRMAELGLLGLYVTTAQGGLETSAVEVGILMQAFGRALVVEPYVSTAVVGASLLARAGTGGQRESILSPLAAGSMRLAVAALEPGARYDLHEVHTTARRTGDTYVLEGRKAVVLDGDSAQALIVAARTAGAPTDRQGITLFLVDAEARGLRMTGFPTIDGHRVAEVALAAVEVGRDAVLGEIDMGWPLLEWGLDRGIAALCAEAVGAMEKLVELTAEHLRTRKQFGQPIGKFQALQHRAADMLIATEQARSMALLAAARVDDPERPERRKVISAAKAMIGRCGRSVGELAVQLHGGMGMTDELPVGHYFKRLIGIDKTWGDVEHHVEQYGELP